jgi:chromosome segregation ATPase
MDQISIEKSKISDEQRQAYQKYCSERDLLLTKKKRINDELAKIDEELNYIRNEFKPVCFHPTKTDPKFNVCAICYDTIEK